MVDRNDPADFAASATLGASQLNALPRGMINSVKLSSNSSGTTSSETILSDTVVLNDDRRLLFMATVTLRSDIPGGIQARIDFDGTQVQRKNSDAVQGASDTFITIMTSKNITAGTYTVELITGVSGADGNTVHAVANGETGTHGTCDLMVIDCGPTLS